MFYALFAAIGVAVLALGVRKDPGQSIRHICLSVMLFAPAWMAVQVRTVLLDHRTAVLGASLLLCFFIYKHLPLRRWLWTDTFIVALYGGVLASQFAIDDFRPLTPIENFRLWVLPYLVGRIFFFRWHEDIPRTLPWVAFLLLLTFGLDGFEAIAKTNIPNKLLGKTYGLLEAGEGYRWGMKRSQGPMDHPIYNGMMLTLLVPWAFAGAGYAKSGEGKKWWLILPVLLAGCLFFTVSRGPQIAFLGSCGAVFFFRYSNLRTVTATVGIVGALAMAFGKDALMELVKSAAGDSEQIRILYIDGEEVEYSGTNHRALLFKVYAQGLEETGWFGYGAGMKQVPIAEGADVRFRSIDNHYIKHILEYGWWGLLSFLGLAISATYYAARLAWDATQRNSMFAAGLAGSIGMTSVMMVSVWFSFDYGSFWLFTVGSAACLTTLKPTSPTSRTTARSRSAIQTTAESTEQPAVEGPAMAGTGDAPHVASPVVKRRIRARAVEEAPRHRSPSQRPSHAPGRPPMRSLRPRTQDTPPNRTDR